MRKATGATITVVVAVLLIGLVLPYGVTGQTLSGKSVRIGVLLPLAGPFGAQGKLQKLALDLAREAINSAGGIKGVPLEYIVYDTQGKGQEAINMMRKLARTDKVLAVLGPFSSTECEVAFPVANREELAVVSASSAKPGVSAKNRPWAFRNSTTMDKLIIPLVAKWQKAHGLKNVVVLYNAGEALFEAEGKVIFPLALKQNNVEIIDTLTFLSDDINFSPQVTKVKALNPGGIVVSSSPTLAANLVREVRRQGLKQPIATSPAAMAPDFIRLAGKDAEGVYTGGNAWEGNPDPKAQAFLQEMRKRSGVTQLDNTAWFMYEAIDITKMIIEQKGVTNRPEDLAGDRQKIRDGWAELKNYKGVSGNTSMNKDGDADKEAVVLEVRNGRFELGR